MSRKVQSRSEETATSFIEVAIRLGALALLLYWSLLLVSPFISIVIWSAVLSVALYPVFEWISLRLGGRRRVAAALVTILSLLVIIGPASWLALGLVDSVRLIAERLDLARRPNRHMSFGTGIHFCLGHQLARIEGKCALEALFNRWPQLKLAMPADAVRWRPRPGLRAIEKLMVEP